MCQILHNTNEHKHTLSVQTEQLEARNTEGVKTKTDIGVSLGPIISISINITSVPLDR